MEISAKGGQAKPETGNATSFNWWFFIGVGEIIVRCGFFHVVAEKMPAIALCNLPLKRQG